MNTGGLVGRPVMNWLSYARIAASFCSHIGLPTMSGLDVLAHVRKLAAPPHVVMMTSDDTSATLLEAVRRQAYRYLRKPFAPSAIVEVIDDAIAAAPASALPIEVVSARPEWLEIIAPCALEITDRLQSFMMHLEADLPEDVREATAQAAQASDARQPL